MAVAHCRPRVDTVAAARTGFLVAMAQMDLRPGHVNIEVPTTIVVGSRDRLTPIARKLECEAELASVAEIQRGGASYQRQRSGWGFNGGGPRSGIHKSVDGGRTWRELTSGLPQGDIGRCGKGRSGAGYGQQARQRGSARQGCEIDHCTKPPVKPCPPADSIPTLPINASLQTPIRGKAAESGRTM